MPTQRVIDVYQFEELSPKAKEKARDWYRRASEGDTWWEQVYEDAAQAGIKITGFDLGRGDDIEGKFTRTAAYTAETISREHGPGTETHKTAEKFLRALSKTKTESDEEALSEQFLEDILADYLVILRREMEYIESDEYIDENIIGNEYEFDQRGNRI